MLKIEDLNYKSKLNLFETQVAIKFVKDEFERQLAKSLNLTRVSAPLFVTNDSGLNDGLSGIEKPVSFIPKDSDKNLEIIHSLAKWKRMALRKYGFESQSGLYTDMNAIRKDEIPDYLHSIYVDQWDWERVIENENRTYSYLKFIVRKIYKEIQKIQVKVSKRFPSLSANLPSKITFVSSREAEKEFPDLSRKQREDALCRKYGAVFLYQIGWDLKDHQPHDSRAADYDDWKLNGDIILYYPLYDMAFEISSMGIRVNKESLLKQLKKKNEEYKLDNDYCKGILNDYLPLTIGGGIGQSRLCMFMLQKAHIGEVQVSYWSNEEIKKYKDRGVSLL